MTFELKSWLYLDLPYARIESFGGDRLAMQGRSRTYSKMKFYSLAADAWLSSPSRLHSRELLVSIGIRPREPTPKPNSMITSDGTLVPAARDRRSLGYTHRRRDLQGERQLQPTRGSVEV